VNIALRLQDAVPSRPKRRHLLIAGTGRAGTSFLVRFLTELGLETHISRFGENPWDQASQAGLEDLPVAAGLENLPHVFKTPWAYQLIEQMLADPAIELEAVIIPMRDLVEAAASRSIVELQAIHGQAPWMARIRRTWEDWGVTNGGVVFSLNPVDQARLLALGFHHLVKPIGAGGSAADLCRVPAVGAGRRLPVRQAEAAYSGIDHPGAGAAVAQPDR
jgi:hypothetical protein